MQALGNAGITSDNFRERLKAYEKGHIVQNKTNTLA
jgi:hypothetical protein